MSIDDILQYFQRPYRIIHRDSIPRPCIEVALSSSISLATPLGYSYLTMLNSRGPAAKAGKGASPWGYGIIEEEDGKRREWYGEKLLVVNKSRSTAVVDLLGCCGV